MDDIKALIVALRAGDYWTAFVLAIKIISQLAPTTPPVIPTGMKSMNLAQLTDALEAESATAGLKSGGQWLQLLLQILQLLLPIILKT